ncbi:Bug family tripartite tricarboxylate transporter substrate binding protein [Paracidovorax citrulli]
MTASIQRRRLILGMAGAAAAWPFLARSEATFPAGPIQLVVPFSAGGQFDSIARQVGKVMSADLKTPVVVENLGGAGGNIAAAKVARAAPNGQTLLMYGGNVAMAASLYKKLEYDPVADFAAVSRVSVAPHVILASKTSGIASFADLRQKAKQSRLSYGSPGVGTSMHLAMEMVKDRFGMDLLHVPYRGGANAMTDLVGGQIDICIIAVGPALEFIRGNKAVPLAVTSAKRSPPLPQVPAIAEFGQPDFDTGSWSGIAVPARTPQAVIDRLNQAVTRGLASAELRKLFESQGFEITPSTPAQMRDYIQRDVKFYEPVLRKLGPTA